MTTMELLNLARTKNAAPVAASVKPAAAEPSVKEKQPAANPIYDLMKRAAAVQDKVNTLKDSTQPAKTGTSIKPKSESAPKKEPAPSAKKDVEPAAKPERKVRLKEKKPITEKIEDEEVAEEEIVLHIRKYKEKWVMVFGDTKPVKDELKSLGGKYNPSLHPFGEDSKVPGWLYKLEDREQVEKYISKLGKIQ